MSRGESGDRRSRRRERLNRETGRPPRPGSTVLEAALGFTGSYGEGMDNLGFQAVHSLIGTHPGTLCERFFGPDPGESGPIPTRTLESDRDLDTFDLVAFSVPFELGYPLVPALLRWAGISTRSSGRSGGAPLVLLGGGAVSANPEPLAPFVDLVLLGEAELALPGLLDLLQEAKQEMWDRTEVLFRASRLPGLYLPVHFEPAREAPPGSVRFIGPDGAGRPGRAPAPAPEAVLPAARIRTRESSFPRLRLVELARGCPRSCRFCLIRRVHRPVRPRTLEDIRRRTLPELAPGEGVGLVACSPGDHPELREICRMLLREGRPVSVSSLRAETLDAELLDLLVESGLRRVTLAPESGSQELRRRIGKSLSDQALVQAVRTVAAAGMTGLKLYYLVGLPGEEEADVHRLVAQVLELRAEARTVTEGARLGFTVSVGCFVPKARTPFQWEGIQTRTTLKQRLRIVHRGLGREPEIKVRTERPRDAWLQALLARGGRSWAGPLESADGDWRRLGQDLPPTAWRWVHERMSHHRPLPWDHLEDPKDRRDLSQEHERFLGQIGEVAA